jgi:hypothetical protein
MAPKRRPRGTLVDPVPIGYEVERVAKDKFDAIADRVGVSRAVMFELVVDHLELTDQGIPTWMPPKSREGELPIEPI